MTTPALSAVNDRPARSGNLLTLVELTQPPYSLGTSAPHLGRKVRDGRLHAHRPVGSKSYKVPEPVAWSAARGDDLQDQIRSCPLCAPAQPGRPRPRR